MQVLNSKKKRFCFMRRKVMCDQSSFYRSAQQMVAERGFLCYTV